MKILNAMCLGAALFLFASAHAAHASERLTPKEVGQILHCLDQKLAGIGYAPPAYSHGAYQARYLFGAQNDQDNSRELNIVVYDKAEVRAVLYKVYLEFHKPLAIDIGEMGTLKKGRKGWEPDEIWGGVGTYHEVVRLIKSISGISPIIVPRRDVVSSHCTCTFSR